jgi:hypothetical protein
VTATYPIPFHFVVFNQTVCHLAAEADVEQVFFRSKQLSEGNLDPDFLADMLSIMVNKLAYCLFLKLTKQSITMIRGGGGLSLSC